MTTTRKPRQFFAVWNDEGTEVKGATFEESIFVDGQFWKNEQTPVAPDSFAAFGDLFSNQLQTQYSSLVAQNAALLEAKTKLESQLASFQADKQLEIDDLNSTHKEQVDSLRSQITEITKQKDDNAALVTAANVRIARLLEGMPWNPRVMEASAFIARIKPEEMLLLASSSDPVLQQAIGMLNRWMDNDWPIVLDSDEIQQTVKYFVEKGIFAGTRIGEVLRDCTKNESYVADE